MCCLTKVRLGQLDCNYKATVYESEGSPVQIKHKMDSGSTNGIVGI